MIHQRVAATAVTGRIISLLGQYDWRMLRGHKLAIQARKPPAFRGGIKDFQDVATKETAHDVYEIVNKWVVEEIDDFLDEPEKARTIHELWKLRLTRAADPDFRYQRDVSIEDCILGNHIAGELDKDDARQCVKATWGWNRSDGYGYTTSEDRYHLDNLNVGIDLEVSDSDADGARGACEREADEGRLHFDE